MSDPFIITTDGGARGNPGPAAIGFTIDGPGITPVRVGEYLGETTNNIAEYTAAIRALAKLKSLIGTDAAATAVVIVRADSELLVKQVNGEYKVKNNELAKLFVQLYNARQDFEAVRFEHIFREDNKEADRMVNEALDAVHSKRQFDLS